jgi:hypothetical protein
MKHHYAEESVDERIRRGISDMDRRIQQRAYFLWIDAGQPMGRDLEFWLAARHAVIMDYLLYWEIKLGIK